MNFDINKNTTILPDWLEDIIYNELGGQKKPDHERFSVNLDLTEEEVKSYLGTYFPRSYCEMFCIAKDLFSNKKFNELSKNKEILSIFDLCPGTGGELLGLLFSIKEYKLGKIREINIDICEGNRFSIEILQLLLKKFEIFTDIKINLKINEMIIKNKNDLNFIGLEKLYDFVLCNKVCCEFKSTGILERPYYDIAQKLSQNIWPDGILLILDVTTKDKNCNVYYPVLMNAELNNFIRSNHNFVTLLPLACNGNEEYCSEYCFLQQPFMVKYHHTDKVDYTRVCYRVICYKSFKEQILDNADYSHMCHIVHVFWNYDSNNFSEKFCPLTSSYLAEQQIDSFCLSKLSINTSND